MSHLGFCLASAGAFASDFTPIGRAVAAAPEILDAYLATAHGDSSRALARMRHALSVAVPRVDRHQRVAASPTVAYHGPWRCLTCTLESAGPMPSICPSCWSERHHDHGPQVAA